MYQFIENHNSNIDEQINDEIFKLISILSSIIINNNVCKLQELISHGIFDEINNMNFEDSSRFFHEIIGFIIEYNRQECLLIISPFIDRDKCKYYDINKFNKKILNGDPYKIIIFLHSNNFIKIQQHNNEKNNLCKLFYKCIQYGSYHTIKYFIHNNFPSNLSENRAIRDAARYGHLNIVKLLHQNGANIHQYNDESLRKAARYGHLQIIKYLLKNNANIHCKNSESLNKSVQNGHIQCVDYLIKTNLLKKNENLLITNIAIKYQKYNCLSLLIRYGYILYNQHLRSLILTDLYGIDNNTIYDHHQEQEQIDINYETESSASPPLSPPGSPQYLSSSSTSSTSSSSSSFENEIVDVMTKERLCLDAISEGLALRETMLISVLTEFIYDEIAIIICSFEKLALTFEDEEELNNLSKNKNKHNRCR